jgi:predicted dinucleotide-binding enzyme
MRIAIIGAGRVGGVLGRRWVEAGHTVVFGVRSPHADYVRRAVAAAGTNASAADIGTAAADAEVVVLATPWQAVTDALAAAGDLAGKVLVDCTNPLLGVTGLEIGHTTSAAEEIARCAPGARVVKAFNTTGAANMADPAYPSGPLTMFLCGDDAAAKATVAALAADVGFAPVDAGALIAARYLEPLAMLWIHLAFAHGYGPDFGITLVRRAPGEQA